jgi:hypothetical protein
MKSLLEPETPPNPARSRAGIQFLLVVSATAIFLAPAALPEGYSWVSNVISESAAQSLIGAWVARFGFLSFGFAVLWLASCLREHWARGAYRCHLLFGIFEARVIGETTVV